MDTARYPTTYLKDYKPPAYLVDSVHLRIELDPGRTRVHSQLSLRRNPDAEDDTNAPLILNGRDLDLESVSLDGRMLDLSSECHVESECLRVEQVPDQFSLEICTGIRPEENTCLEGLYVSGGMLCTQCEAEGFRRITYYPDRPDVLARFHTTLVADASRFPVLLSNGNPVDGGELEDGRHWATFDDPFPKPCYLFALVAGDLECIEGQHTTPSGRNISLRLYAEQHNIDKCTHAMDSLETAMAWDEEINELECDLDEYIIVATDHFNMGAMENKGLNIFNARYVVADATTATDRDFAAIEAVVGHEYFHNWTGNRVTCRDWFQLSLKEGLTVFREQEFSAAVGSAAVKRIQDVRFLRNHQFPEDAGPMAHAVRPDAYMEISNFYTTTIYNKGAEVIRMLHTLLGEDVFGRGLSLYLQRHDGSAATTDDFVAAMEDTGDVDLRQFRRWYSQAGTPVVEISGSYDADNRRFTLTARQSCPATPGQDSKQPFHIPLSIGLLDQQGNDLPIRLAGEPAGENSTTRVLELNGAQQTFEFEDVPCPPVPSLFRGYSAPVIIHSQLGEDTLAFQLANDNDSFCRWEAGHQLATRILLSLVDDISEERLPDSLPDAFVNAMRKALTDPALDPALAAEILTLPSEGYLAQQREPIPVDAVHQARRHLRVELAGPLKDDLLGVYTRNATPEEYEFSAEHVAMRSLRNVCLDLLMTLEHADVTRLCMQQFSGASNMTDRLAALQSLSNYACPERESALENFYREWRNDPLVLDKWFAIQAMSQLPGTLDTVKRLTRHPAFDASNPNRYRALVGSFCHGNPTAFHKLDASGYRFLSTQVIAVDQRNPQVAARLLSTFSRWRNYDEQRRAAMRAELQRITDTPGLSRDSYDVATRIFGSDNGDPP
ncbi:MAG: aminopeptidase N [Gammaproteobacteria bacterium]|nr:MAG: aminopeptidase N [Gammaproteobacteria bacterium]